MVELTKILNSDSFCQCTFVNNKKCENCGNYITYINTPHGSVPTIKIFETFLKKTEELIDNKFVELSGNINNRIEVFDEKLEEIQGNANEIIKNLEARFINKKNELDVLSTSTLQKFDKKSQKFQYTVAQSFRYFKDVFKYLSNMMDSLFKMNYEVKIEKDQYFQEIYPQLEKFIKKLNILDKILPNTNILSNNLEISDPEEFFDTNQNYLTANELSKENLQFNNVYNEIISKSLQNKNILKKVR